MTKFYVRAHTKTGIVSKVAWTHCHTSSIADNIRVRVESVSSKDGKPRSK